MVSSNAFIRLLLHLSFALYASSDHTNSGHKACTIGIDTFSVKIVAKIIIPKIWEP